MQRIDSEQDLAAGLDALVAADARLAAMRATAGPVALRRVAPGFASLVSVIVAQQVSRASAAAILGRLSAACAPLAPETVRAAGPDGLGRAGLSRGKQRAVLALAAAVADGTLDLDGLTAREAGAAIAALTALPGVGPWTAEVYLLTAAGHPDIFPAGDVALRAAAAHGLALGRRPTARELAAIAESWAPWRSAAARLLWAHYRTIAGREALLAP
ncbi:DNA-3-methyladenine glycosylase 2 family protein [Aquibium sp. A9E412]|uniref:DNA-3-methyladenine glycosylase family protein n=1 Tax=Aquibium sp. A9E412 TaxID=2976767 RepID=UPI0025B24204|nr:DNA-3-methyladenine glycosylase 2 family protein [Aquibium sp. A9E412]MDN2566491.1 DNA-3-methyladenine glycosylase 2 family protein [Aquibium sp. A9E412]